MTLPPPVPYNKQFTTIEDQIKRLEYRGMSIDNKKIAARWLKRVGYYRLSGYWYELREQDCSTPTAPRRDDFKSGSMFKDIIRLYLFDEKLRLLMLQAISPIEVALRAQVMYVLSKKDAQAYLNTAFFQRNFTQPLSGRRESQYDAWLEKIKSSVERSKNEPFLEHFFKKYCREDDPDWWETLPLWMLVDCWDFGVLSKCCSGLKTPWCSQVTKHFGSIPVPIMTSWMYTLNLARNFAAHHCRIWNRWWNVAIPKIPPTNNMDGYFEHITALYQTNKRIQRSTYMVLAIMKYFLIWTVEDRGQGWGSEIKALLNKFPGAFGDPSKLGFPENWEKEPLWDL
jgi:abortive infection bacteriophage resistance protein